MFQQSSSAIRYSGTWSTATSARASGGSLAWTATRGASGSYTFTGSGVSWVAYRGPDRGSAAVYVDGLLAATVNLNATSYLSRQVVFAANWSVNGTHTVRVVCLGTAGHARIDIDGFVRLVRL